MKSLSRKVDSFDGQTITVDGKPCYELGGFLGGGAAGVVYEGADVSDDSHAQPVAIKILNPVGFRLAPEDTLRRCVVARRGKLPNGAVENGSTSKAKNAGRVHVSDLRPVVGAGSSGAGGAVAAGGALGLSNKAQNAADRLGPEHVWWLVSPNTKQVLAAYIDPRFGNLVELPLPKCIEIWGYNPRTDFSTPSSCGSPNRGSKSRGGREVGGDRMERTDKTEDGNSAGFGGDCEGGCDSAAPGPGTLGTGGVEVQVDGMGVSIPWVPPKFVQWLAQRSKVRREICNMGRVGGHRNVVKLLSVLEFLQDSKSTLFLILELVTGGELLDHIRPIGENSGGAGSRSKVGASALRAEGSAQRYFGQLLSGLSYCHSQGVCHRDLSPSNLLLEESLQGHAQPELKIADFGLSACCAMPSSGNENQDAGLSVRVSSIVGSPHYMAPEVTDGSTNGYDGFKADAWSCGVVLYTMLTASLPFGRELARCSRYKRWKKWAEKHRIGVNKTASTSTSAPSSLATTTAVQSAGMPSLSESTADGISTSKPTATQSPSPVTAVPPALSSPPIPPQWLFPGTVISPSARSLLVALLTPDPARRMSIDQAVAHPWLTGGVSPSHGVPGSLNNTESAGKGRDSGGADKKPPVAPAGKAGVATTTVGREDTARNSGVFVADWKSPWEKARKEEGAGVAARRREQKQGGLSPEEMFATCISFAPTTSFP